MVITLWKNIILSPNQRWKFIMKKLIFSLISTLFFFAIDSLWSQVPYNAEFKVNTNTSNYQWNPKIGMDSQGNYVVVWGSRNSALGDGNGFGIAAQKYSLDGQPIGNEFLVNTHITNDQDLPAIDVDATGNFIVVWQSDMQEDDTSGLGIYAQRFNSNLTKIGSEFHVNTVTKKDQFRPDVAMLANGNFVIVWESTGIAFTSDTLISYVYAQMFDSDGNKISGEFKVDEDTPDDVGSRRRAKVVALPGGGFAVSYSTYTSSTSHSDVFIKIYDENGNVDLGETRVNSTTEKGQILGELAANQAGQMVAIWESHRDFDVVGRRIASDGSFLGSEFTANTYTTGSIGQPSVDIDSSGYYVVSWTSPQQDSDTAATSGIYGQKYDDQGNRIGEEFHINSYTYNEQSYSSIAVKDRGDFVVAWQSWRQDGQGWGIYAQMYKSFPVLTALPNLSFDEDMVHMLPITDYFAYVSDANNGDEELTWQFGNGSHLTSSVSNDSLSLSPEQDWFGEDSFMVIVSDPVNLSDTTYQKVTVSAVNDAPVVADIPDQTVNEGESFVAINLDNYVADVDNADAEMSWNFTGNSELSVNINPATRVGVISIPNATWNGAETITFTATDPGLLSDNDAATFTVESVNDAPTVVTPIVDQNLSEDFGTAQIADLDDVFSDIDEDELTFSATSGGNVVPSIDGENVLSLTSTQNYNGMDTVLVTANDNVSRASVTDTFLVEVTIVNDAPVVSGLPDVNVAEDGTATLSLDDYVSDVDDVLSDLIWSSTVLSAQVLEVGVGDLQVSIDPTSHVATFSLSADTVGLFEVEFVATDTSGASGKDTLEVSVDAENDAPVISTLPEIIFPEDDSLSYAVAAFYDYVEDVETADSDLIYLLIGGDFIVYMVENDSIKIKTQAANWFGKDTMMLVVSDGFLSDTAAIYITVESVNDIPEVDLPSFLEFSADSSVVLMLWDYVSDVETADSSLTFTFGSSNDSLSYNYDGATGELTVNANLEFSGNVTLTVNVEDEDQAVVSNNISVMVNPNSIEFFSDQIPATYVLEQNYPNPFNPVTHIRFGLPSAANVKLEVYNLLGQRVLILLENKQLAAGYHTVDLNAGTLASGIYVYRIESENFSQVKKMILMK
jgi:hypothetical protein